MNRATLRVVMVVALAELVCAAGARAGDGDELTPAQRRARDFEYSLWDRTNAANELRPLAEEKQRPLFEAFVMTLKTPEEKAAFLELAGYRYVYPINPNVFVDFAVRLLKDEDAGVRMAALKGIRFFRMISDEAMIKGDGKRIDGYVDAVAPLMASEKDASIRGAAMWCVGTLHGAKYVDALIGALDRDPADAARAGAGAGLVWLAAGSGVPADARRSALAAVVRHVRGDEKEDVVQAMLVAPPGITELDTRAFADGVAAMLGNERLRAPAIRALKGLKASAHAGEVAALVFDPVVGPSDGHDAEEALAVIATREQMPTLLKLLESRSGYTRLLALEALERLDARDQRGAVEKAAVLEAAEGNHEISAKELLRKWDKAQ